MAIANSENSSIAENVSHLIFIDRSVDNYQTIIEDSSNRAEVVLLDSNYDGIEQISHVLARHSNLETVEIIAHGDVASLTLGNTNLDRNALEDDRLESWSQAFSEYGDILIYGCNVAFGEAGQTYVDRLGQITETEIAASEDLTGSTRLGGDWDLEVTTGAIESTSALNPLAIDNFNSILVAFNGNEYQLTTSSQTWAEAQAEAESLGGNLVTINDIIEQQWISQTFGTEETFWIGLNDSDNEGEFVWSSGEDVTYTNWRANQPDNYNNREDFTLINWNGDPRWNDAPGAAKFRGIIEIKSEPGEISLQSDSYTSNEGDGAIAIEVQRTGGNSGTIAVDYQTVNSSASADTDYTAVSGTLTFAAGETSKTINIPITDDLQAEANESFNLILDSVTGGGNLSEPRTASITIVDNDSNNFEFDNFTNTSELTFNGDTTQAGDSLRLTSTSNGSIGSAFFKEAIAVDNDTSFQTQFQFQLGGSAGTNGASGFTFMLQNSSSQLNALGGSGSRLGYGNIDNSFAIEFDNYDSGDYDLNNNHISSLVNGDVTNPLLSVNAPFDLNSGNPLNAWIDYDGSSDRLEVFLSNDTVKPNSAILTQNIDLASLLGDRALVGFSAANGFNNVTNIHEIQNWSFSSTGDFVEPPTISDLLPDLQIIAESVNEGLRVDTSEQPGRALLRFTSEVANTGNGPLEIWADELIGNTQPVFQRIYRDDGSSRDVAAGGFSYFEPHGHSHFDDFAVFNLRQVNGDGSVGDIVATGDSKYSFCLINLRQPFPELSDNATIVDGRGGDSCGDIQGISVGYSDVYNSNLANQWIDVTNVADGTYWLETIVDPKNRILETNDENNVTRTQVTVNNPLV